MVHFIWHIMTERLFFTSSDQSRYTLWSCQNVCDALSYLLDNIYIRFGTKLYRQIVGIPMGTNCAPLVADLFLYCYERDFMDSLNHDNQADVIEAFNTFTATPLKKSISHCQAYIYFIIFIDLLINLLIIIF